MNTFDVVTMNTNVDNGTNKQNKLTVSVIWGLDILIKNSLSLI
jgi:hypothetical protein